MPTVDWSRVEAGTFHDFHNSWIIHIKESLNAGLLPPEYYAMSEQRVGGPIPDVVTLHADSSDWPSHLDGGLAVAEAPPRVSTKLQASAPYERLRRTVAIRLASGDRVVALIEIVSPANKDRPSSVQKFADKAFEALESGINVLLVDLVPPGRFDPEGMHGAIWSRFPGADDFERPADRPFTLASYVADSQPTAYVEAVGLGQELPPMPLFLNADRYIEVPLERTHAEAYAGVPERWRRVIEE